MPAPAVDARARAIVARLSEGNASSDEVFAAFEELDHLPPEIVRGAFEPWTGPAPDVERLDDQVRRAHRLPLRTPQLTLISSERDADVLDLGDTAEAQLRLAGKTWDGQDLDAWERLDGEREDSFAGTLERRVLGEGGKPLYDVVLFGEGAGVIFRADTTSVLGIIADHLIETTDRPARLALEQVLRNSPATVERVQQEQLALPIVVADKPKVEAPKVAKVVKAPKVEAPPVEEEEEVEAAPAPKKKRAAAKKEAPAAPKKKAAAAAAAPKKKAAAAAAPAPKKKKATATSKKKKASAARDDE